jgi:hypothetical protein
LPGVLVLPLGVRAPMPALLASAFPAAPAVDGVFAAVSLLEQAAKAIASTMPRQARSFGLVVISLNRSSPAPQIFFFRAVGLEQIFASGFLKRIDQAVTKSDEAVPSSFRVE